MAAEIIPFNRRLWNIEQSFEWWCAQNGRDSCAVGTTNEDDYKEWAHAQGIDPIWEVPF